MLDTAHLLLPTRFPPITRRTLSTLQANLGYRCNQSCVHCHVNAGPKRTEVMSRETVDMVIDLLRERSIGTLDLTGGAPELSPHFRYLVERAAGLGVRVIDRCNLTVLEEPAQQGLDEFLAGHGVEIVASLPCYLEENVDQQRGRGVFETSLRALRRLNRLGYGCQGSPLTMNLVYNPQGAVLPPPQCALEKDYKKQLFERHGIQFNSLFVLTNMPIKRFGSTLRSKGHFDAYLDLLRSAYQEENLDTVMCRSLISVDWRGFVYDCDFNQMLDIPAESPRASKMHISDLFAVDLRGTAIQVADHCYGCTAGQGSSCGGALEG